MLESERIPVLHSCSEQIANANTMGFGIFFLEALRGMDWQLYVPHFAQIVCTMTFRTRQFDMTAHGITIVMCTFCRLLHEFHNLRAQDKPGWGRANSHTNCWNSQVWFCGTANGSCSKRQKVHITIVMPWAVMCANYHTNCWDSHANCVRIPNADTNFHEFPNKFAL